MASLNAGLLDREIVLQTATSEQSDSGEPIVTWGSDETIWAQWFSKGTTEAWRAQQRLEGVIEGVFRIYWRDDIAPDVTRIVFDGKTFDVRPPVEIGRQEGLDIPVTALAV